MIKKTKIYHLHIPKTGGQYINSTILIPLNKTFEENNIKNIAIGHACWRKITDETYIVTCFRDPVQRTVSHFCYYLKSSLNVNNIKSSKKEFLNWISQNKNYISNFQSKNLIYEDSIINAPFFFLKDDNFLNISKVNKNDVFNKAKRVDLLLKNDRLNAKYSKIAKEKICNDFEIKIQKEPNKTFFNKNKESFSLYSELTIKEIDFIYSINDIDSDIYFDESLFDIP
jgi:hypothetical protein